MRGVRCVPDGVTEAQGLTFVEAMMAGAPVIATDIGGIGDAVRHEETGLVVSEAAPAEIAAAIERLIGDPGLVERITAAGRALARARFTRRAAATAFSALFSALRNERPGGALSSARDAS